MLDKLCISKETGEVVNVELVCMFLITEINKQFVITTINEIDPNGLVKLHVSELKDHKLTKVEIEEDWVAIKSVMRSIISSSPGNYKYLPVIENATSVTDYTRGIAVQIVAKEQLATDYQKNRPSQVTAAVENVPEQPIEPSAPAHVMTETNIPSSEGEIVAPGIVETQTPPNDFEKVEQIETPTDLIIDDQPIDPLKNNDPIKAAENITPSAPVVDVTPPAPPAFDMNAFQQMYQQMMAMQQGVNNIPNQNNLASQNQPVESLSDAEFEKIASEAREVFMASAKELADRIIADVHEKIKSKEQN